MCLVHELGAKGAEPVGALVEDTAALAGEVDRRTKRPRLAVRLRGKNGGRPDAKLEEIGAARA